MSAFLYGVALQWRLDIRSKSLLITCYVVPLLFFIVMGGIFTSLTPGASATLIQSMTVMGVSMGALVGLPPSLSEIYSGDIKKVYRANGVPLSLGLATTFLSAFVHLLLMSAILYIAAPLLFGAARPRDPLLYLLSLAIFIAASLGVASVLGLAVKSQAKLTMFSQMVFLPSIMLSGIMFPAELLPRAFGVAGRLFPAAWGYRAMLDGGFGPGSLWPLGLLMAASAILCALLLKKLEKDA
ncbi:ABC transporter permease [Allofournierella sp.]|uniref:ABC transporter permease n=1 Tax=Allofournierella sp. TaxID=1940256 RepID=UPI003AB1AE11